MSNARRHRCYGGEIVYPPLLHDGAEWDQLLAVSKANTIFLSSGWLRAAFEIFGEGKNLLVPQARQRGRLIATAAFQERNGVIVFVGKGPSDYLDLVLSA